MPKKNTPLALTPEKVITNTDNATFQKLTPVNNVDLGVYEEALDYAFEEKDIKNIAVSGAYGSGKTSILETYKKNSKYKFITISLANFEDIQSKKPVEKAEESETPVKDEEPEKVEEESKKYFLEKKIINQLIHQVPVKKIPLTKFKVKQKFIVPITIVQSILFVLFIFLFLHSFKILEFDFLTTRCVSNILKILFFGLLGFFIFYFLKFNKETKILKKIKYHTTEIDLFDDTTDSYFDKYLDEILYLFENVNVNAIIFEDIDRYNNTQIFTRLREFNNLLNIKLEKEAEFALEKKAKSWLNIKQEEKPKRAPLKFFYLIRDDIFTSTDRVKFFDFIMPVVPVLGGSNAYDQIISYFENTDFFKEMEQTFLSDMFLYIDDMRLLKNIWNEFIVYENKLTNVVKVNNAGETDNANEPNKINLNYNKMLAMVTYKNLFPKDFNNLQHDAGFVYSVIKESLKYNSYLKGLLNNLKAEYNNFKTEFNNLKIEYENKKTELEKQKTEYSPLEAEFKNLKIEFESKTTKFTNNIISLKQIILIEKNNIKDIFNNDVGLVVDSSEFFKNVVTYNLLKKIDNFSEVKENKYINLLKFLLREGYIDDSYEDYTTYFYGKSLSRQDKNFLLSILNRKAEEYNYKLNKPLSILKDLKKRDEIIFKQAEILNFNLIDYLLENKNIYAQEIELICKELQNTVNYKFIKEAINNLENKKLFIENINLNWPQLWAVLYVNNKFKNSEPDAVKQPELLKICKTEKDKSSIIFSAEDLNLFSLYSLETATSELIAEINLENSFTAYISEEENYLYNEEAKTILTENKNAWPTIIKNLKNLKVAFININYEKTNKELFSQIYENSLYKINWANLSLMLSVTYKLTVNEDYQHKNYTLIMEKPNQPLAIYINENIEDYIKIVLENANKTIKDDEVLALQILNNKNLSLTVKEEYLSYLKTEISILSAVSEINLYEDLLNNIVIKYSEENIITWFNINKKLTESLIAFINSKKENLNFSYLKEFSEETAISFFNVVFECNSLSDIKYEEILSTIGYIKVVFKFEDLSENKINFLIENNLIEINLKNIKIIKTSYKNEWPLFMAKNPKEYVDIFLANSSNTEVFKESDLILALNIKEISDEDKIKLLNTSKQEISVLNKEETQLNENFSTAIMKHILENKFLISDLKVLLSKYNSLLELQAVIFQKVSKNLIYINENNIKVPIALRKELIGETNITVAELINRVSYNIFTDNEKITILNMVDGHFSVFNEDKGLKYPLKVTRHILENNFFESDLTVLISGYELDYKELQEDIVTLLVKLKENIKFDNIIKTPNISLKILKDLLKKLGYWGDDKTLLLFTIILERIEDDKEGLDFFESVVKLNKTYNKKTRSFTISNFPSGYNFINLITQKGFIQTPNETKPVGNNYDDYEIVLLK